MSAAPLRLLALLAHPDDEALGLGGVLARYASEGVETYVLTATRGQAGRYRGIRPGEPGHPGAEALAELRERELRAAIAALGVHELVLLEHHDGRLAEVPHTTLLPQVVAAIRRIRPQVVLTFGPDGAYGHPDHIAISQAAVSGAVAAADAGYMLTGEAAALAPYSVAKLYYMAWDEANKQDFERTFRSLTFIVDGEPRDAHGWPAWQITTTIDTRAHWDTMWAAIQCHHSQIGSYDEVANLSRERQNELWGEQSFYRVFSTVNSGRTLETDLFEGLRS